MAQTFKNEKRTPLWKILYNSLVMIIAFAIVGAILGFGANKLFSKPVYTAMQSFILRMEITEEKKNDFLEYIKLDYKTQVNIAIKELEKISEKGNELDNLLDWKCIYC